MLYCHIVNLQFIWSAEGDNTFFFSKSTISATKESTESKVAVTNMSILHVHI